MDPKEKLRGEGKVGEKEEKEEEKEREREELRKIPYFGSCNKTFPIRSGKANI